MFQILIVEDDHMIRKLLRKMLQRQGYEVVEAESGELALTQLRELRPALIICTYFILLTADNSHEREIQGLDGGADDFLSKPIHLDELSARVRAGLRLHQALQQQQQLTQQIQTQQKILEAELKEAADYIRTLLPKPMQDPLTIHSKFLPSRHLGGDCFDYYWLDSDYLAIYLLDVSGHGLRSALVSVSVHNLLQSHALPKVNFYRPDHVLAALNEIFQISPEDDRYFTMWYGVYNRQKRDLLYSSAGHPPAILISGTSPETLQVQQLKTRGMPIGMFPDAKYFHQRCKIEESSTMYIFSDGIYEITEPDGNPWSFSHFTDLLVRQHQSDRSNLDAIVQQVQAIQDNSDFEDDCSLLQVNL
jgi:phosphoserine phosphatase RsbU/P